MLGLGEYSKFPLMANGHSGKVLLIINSISNVIHKRVDHTSERITPNRTKTTMKGFANHTGSTCNFVLRLLDVRCFCYFVLEFTSGLVAEISDSTAEIRRKFTDLCTSQMATNSCLTEPFNHATALQRQNFGF